MAEIDPVEDLKAKAALATAEAALVQAKTQLIKAQQELAAANQPPDPLVAAANAEKARIEAQKALAQAATGAVTGSSTYTGTVEVKGDAAGKGEATLLASRAIKCAAATIARATGEDVRSASCVVLMQGAEAPQFANYRQFLLQEDLIAQIFAAAKKEAERLSREADRICGTAHLDAQKFALPALATADVVLNAISKLGSYFMSNYEIGGIALTSDGEQLVSAVAGELVGSGTLVLPARAVPQAADFSEMVKGLPVRPSMRIRLQQHWRPRPKPPKRGPKAPRLPTRRNCSMPEKLYEQGAAVLRKAITKSEEFVSALMVSGHQGHGADHQDRAGASHLHRAEQERRAGARPRRARHGGRLLYQEKPLDLPRRHRRSMSWAAPW